MTTVVKNFTNELGNEIGIAIRDREETTEIQVWGPNSQDEWELTKMETLELFNALKEHYHDLV